MAEFILDKEKPSRKERFYKKYDEVKDKIKYKTRQIRKGIEAQDRNVNLRPLTNMSWGGLGVRLPRAPPILPRGKRSSRGRYDEEGRVIPPKRKSLPGGRRYD